MRFIEIFDSKNVKDSRKLSFADLALGDSSMDVVGQIVRDVRPWSLDLSKNNFSDTGLASISAELQNSTSVVHLNLSGNQITPEGAQSLF